MSDQKPKTTSELSVKVSAIIVCTAAVCALLVFTVFLIKLITLL